MLSQWEELFLRASPVKAGLTSRVATYHCRASSRSRCRGERHSHGSGAQAWKHQSLRRDYSPYRTGRFGKVHRAGRRRREDSAKTSLADRCLSAALAPVAVTLCGRKMRVPLESDRIPANRPYNACGHIIRTSSSLARLILSFEGRLLAIVLSSALPVEITPAKPNAVPGSA